MNNNSKHKFLVIGHRGACGYEPENTIRSFRKTLDIGVDVIELDVYVLTDGSLAVMHDDKVNRTTDGKGYIFNMSLEEVKKLDAGQGERVPTLQEVLDLVNHQAQVNIELKGVGTAGPVAKAINEYVAKGWTYDDFIISSFNHRELRNFRKILSQVKIGALITGLPVDNAKFAEDLGAYSANLSSEFVDEEFVEDAHKRGLQVYIWTVNELDDLGRMRAMGVDGVFTNFPDRILEAVRQ